MQNKVEKFNKEEIKREPLDIYSRMLDIQSEVGELSKEILKVTDYGQTVFISNEDFEMEFGDVIYSLMSLANETNIDAYECLEKVLDKYRLRFGSKNNIGSGK